MVYQLATPHETLAKKNFSIPQVLQFGEREFSKQNASKSNL